MIPALSLRGMAIMGRSERCSSCRFSGVPRLRPTVDRIEAFVFSCRCFASRRFHAD
jgi:hypothetical protein